MIDQFYMLRHHWRNPSLAGSHISTMGNFSAPSSTCFICIFVTTSPAKCLHSVKMSHDKNRSENWSIICLKSRERFNEPEARGTVGQQASTR